MTEPSQTHPTIRDWAAAFQLMGHTGLWLASEATNRFAGEDLPEDYTLAFSELSDDSDPMIAAQHILERLAFFTKDGPWTDATGHEPARDSEGYTLRDYMDITKAILGEDDTNALTDLLPEDGADELWDYGFSIEILAGHSDLCWAQLEEIN